jgi:hypothetical protein
VTVFNAQPYVLNGKDLSIRRQSGWHRARCRDPKEPRCPERNEILDVRRRHAFLGPDEGGRDVFVHFERLKTLDLNAPAFNLASHGR